MTTMMDQWMGAISAQDKWNIIEQPLAKAGIRTSKVPALRRISIISQAEVDEVIGADEEAWNAFADMLIEEHPSWESLSHRRLRHARAIMNPQSVTIPSWFDVPEDDDIEASKYLIEVGSAGGHEEFYVAKDRIDIAKIAIGTWMSDADDSEWVDTIWDLDVGQPADGLNYITTLSIEFSDTDDHLVVTKLDGGEVKVNGVDESYYRKMKEESHGI